MDPELTKRVDTLEDKIDLIYTSVEKTRKYFLTTAIISVLAVVLPIIGLAFAIPSFLNSYVGQINSLDSLSQ